MAGRAIRGRHRAAMALAIAVATAAVGCRRNAPVAHAASDVAQADGVRRVPTLPEPFATLARERGPGEYEIERSTPGTLPGPHEVLTDGTYTVRWVAPFRYRMTGEGLPRMVLSLRSTGPNAVDGRALSDSEIESRLAAAARAARHSQVVIEAEPGVSASQQLRWVRAAQDAGLLVAVTPPSD